MKKIGILLAILLVAGAYAMADETAAAHGELFADVGAAALSQAEMESVDGGCGIKEIKVGVGGIKVTRDAELARVDYAEARARRNEKKREKERRIAERDYDKGGAK